MNNGDGTKTCSICGKMEQVPFVASNAGLVSFRVESVFSWYKRLWNVLTCIPRYIITGKLEI